MRVISVAHVAMAPDLPDPTAGSDARNARWWAVEDLDLSQVTPTTEAPLLAFDHTTILTDAIERVRSKIEYTTLATQFLSEPFSLGDLRRVYGCIWGRPPALGPFRRKVLATDGFVVETAEVKTSSATEAGGRPPRLFTRGSASLLHPAMLRTNTDDEA